MPLRPTRTQRSAARFSPASTRSMTPSSAPPPPWLAAVAVKDTELALEVPARLTQVSVYVKVPGAVGEIVWVPLVASVPLQLPEAVQLVALTADQLIVVELPTAMDAAGSVSAGGPGAISASAAS